MGATSDISLPVGGDQDRGPQLLTATAVTIAFAFVVVALRFYSRLRMSTGVGKDDYTLLVALVSRPSSYMALYSILTDCIRLSQLLALFAMSLKRAMAMEDTWYISLQHSGWKPSSTVNCPNSRVS